MLQCSTDLYTETQISLADEDVDEMSASMHIGMPEVIYRASKLKLERGTFTMGSIPELKSALQYICNGPGMPASST